MRRNNLGEHVPRLCVERRRSRRSGRFFIFLGINSDQKGVLPPAVASHLQMLVSGLKGRPVADVYIQDIKSMISGEIDISDYARTIKYQPPQTFPVEDPFATEIIADTVENKPAESYNQLLYWLSVIGSGSWDTFRTICQNLLPPDSPPPRQIFRRLRLLGHVEYQNKAKRWVICPPCLVQIGNVPHPACYLAGQRTPQMIEQLSRQANWVSRLFHPGGLAPDCVRLTFETMQLAETAVANVPHLRFAGDAANRLATLLPPLDEWQKELETLPSSHIVSGHYNFQQWCDNAFQPVAFGGESGFYQLTRHDVEHNPPQFILFYNAGQECWQRGDWYDLRYLAQHRSGQIVPARYQPQTRQCAIHLNSRWPHLYERALVLASGQLPQIRDGWLYFTNIAPQLGQTLAAKLDTSLEKTNA